MKSYFSANRIPQSTSWTIAIADGDDGLHPSVACAGNDLLAVGVELLAVKMTPARARPGFPGTPRQHPYVDRQPAVWQHDIFHPDGTPYRPREVWTIRTLTSGK